MAGFRLRQRELVERPSYSAFFKRTSFVALRQHNVTELSFEA